MITDPIGDMICRINNANKKFIERIDVPCSKLKTEICRILKEEGYISSYKKIEDYKQGILRISLKYGQNKERAIREIKRVSKPGLRIYRKWDELPRVYRGLGIAIISTSKGLMTDKDARRNRLGGEVLCKVF